MANKKESKTRRKIVDAACKLFSEFGLDSVSTRMIADEAGVHLGSIHYYFDDKEALYVEVFRIALEADDQKLLDRKFRENLHLLETPEGKSELIRIGIELYFKHCFVQSEDWKRRLVFRELTQVSGIAPKLMEEILKPRLERGREFFKLLSSVDSPVDSFLWMHIPSYVATFFLLIKPTLDRTFDQEFNDDLYSKLAAMTAKMMILVLDLPLPEKLRKGEDVHALSATTGRVS